MGHWGSALRLAVQGAVLLVLATPRVARADLECLDLGRAPYEQVFSGPAGPYHLVVEMCPRAPGQALEGGEMHAKLRVGDPISGRPVEDAQVLVLPRPPQRGIVVMEARPTTQLGGLYFATFPVDRTGDWTLTVRIEGGAGAGTAEVGFSVRQAGLTSRLGKARLLGAAALILLLGAAAGLRYRGRRVTSP